MTRKLLDTTFLIHYWGGRPAAKEYLGTHEQTADFLTTTLNIKELAVGRALQGALDRVEIASKFGWLSIVPFELDHAVAAGQIEAALRQELDPNQDRINALTGDLLIAAVAKAENAAVVTRNIDDFEALDDVSVETY